MERVFLIVLLGFFFGKNVHADHPNEGSLGLQDLVQEALAQNHELKALTHRLDAAKSEMSAARGAYFPELSIEGGPLETKFDSEKNSGTAVYGKAEWNLYRGGRDKATSDIKGLDVELAEKQIRQNRARIEREIGRLFYEMLFLLESVALNEKAHSMNQDQMKLARVKNQSGFTSSADVIEFELREATLKSDLKKLLQEKGDRSRELSVLLGRKEPSGDLSVRGHLKKNIFRGDRTKLFSEIEKENPELVEALFERQIAEKERDVARSEFFPKLDVEGRYGKIANEERVFSERDNYSVFLKLKVPLFSGFSTRNEVGAAGSRVQQKESEFTYKVLSKRAEADSLLSQLDLVQERLELEEKTLQRSEDYYKITLGEYRRGVKNSPDMVGAAERLLEARIRNLEYRRDFYLAKIRLSGLTGAGVKE